MPAIGGAGVPHASLKGAAGSISNFCQVGLDPYEDFSVAANTGPTDALGYASDVTPIPAAMNASGYAVVAMHRKDNNTAGQRIGFYVARYGPVSGLSAFTRVDDASGYTFGGSVAIDASGNIAAVWEQRTLLTRTTAARSGCAATTAAQAENHVYFRYYNASTGAWTTTTQVDDTSIVCYGNSSSTGTYGAVTASFWPEAPMAPAVAFGGGNALITWSGPACATRNSSSCRRRQMADLHAVMIVLGACCAHSNIASRQRLQRRAVHMGPRSSTAITGSHLALVAVGVMAQPTRADNRGSRYCPDNNGIRLSKNPQ